ncbi:DUF4309 domain-containing protein [Paenibacillus sp. YYML68]|uniref:DUF4309 domain-containing protein n=1 Tax=Paenibacillus sp. YYML68 TaxID=2909250 RepID=UPI0024919635|nr:DUF4309 domain-containing protein [Paenibacillus sp. YYML68]
MNRRKAFIGFLSVVISVALLLLAGCEPKPQASPHEQQPNPHEQFVEATSTLPPATAEHSDGKQVPAPTTPLPAGDDKVALASANTDKDLKPAQGSADKSGEGQKPTIKIDTPYSQAKPTLLGITLKTKRSSIIEDLGKPKEEFIMDEDEDPITVYDYTDFLIGFDSLDQVHFIDVRSEKIDTGLNGVKLGDPTSSITKALGKPTTNSNYVITYKASGSVLKLDIDPKTQTINSIKLFAE